MRRQRIGPIILLGCLVLALVLPWRLRAQPNPPSQTSEGAAVPPGSVHTPQKPWDDLAYAGLPPETHPEVLTLERVFALALIRLRSPQPVDGRITFDPLDPDGFDTRAKRLHVADFDHLRKDFLTQPAPPQNQGPELLDPVTTYFDLLGRLQAVENARRFLADLEDLKSAYEKIEAEAPNRAKPARLDLWLPKAKSRYSETLRTYREALGRWKVELGLSPDAPIVPDRRGLEPFQTVFEKIEAWFSDPDRERAELPAIAGRLPRLEEGLPGLPPLDRVSLVAPERLEALFRAADQALITNRGQVALSPEVRRRVHQRIKHLLELRASARKEKQRWLSVLRTKDQVFERLMAPPQPGGPVAVPDLIGLHSQALEGEVRLVALWGSYHTERMALARELGVVPGRDWKSFLSQITR